MEERIILIKQSEDLNNWIKLLDFLWLEKRELHDFIENHVYLIDKEELKRIKIINLKDKK